MDKKRIKNILKTCFKFIVTGTALYLVFKKIAFKEVLTIYLNSNFWYLLIALALFVFSKTVAAFRLNRLFKALSIQLHQQKNLQLYLLGMFYNLFLPGGIGGDGYKIYLLNKKYKTGVKPLFGAILTDRLSGLAALGVLALLFFAFSPEVIVYQWATLFLIPLVLVGFYLFLHWFYNYFKQLYVYLLSQGALVQVLQTICAFFILLALGMHSDIWAYLFLFLISSIVAVLPITIGGVGARELTFLYGAQLFQLDTSISVALSLMFYIITAFTSFWGIIWVVKPIELNE